MEFHCAIKHISWSNQEATIYITANDIPQSDFVVSTCSDSTSDNRRESKVLHRKM
jgi:hypothetical protein